MPFFSFAEFAFFYIVTFPFRNSFLLSPCLSNFSPKDFVFRQLGIGLGGKAGLNGDDDQEDAEEGK